MDLDTSDGTLTMRHYVETSKIMIDRQEEGFNQGGGDC